MQKTDAKGLVVAVDAQLDAFQLHTVIHDADHSCPLESDVCLGKYYDHHNRFFYPLQ